MSKPTPYDVLGVPPDADAPAIKRAYRKKAASTHPDKTKGGNEPFLAVQRAYTILSDDEARRRYDATGEDNPKDVNQQRQMTLSQMALAGIDKFDSAHDDILAIMRDNIRNMKREYVEAQKAAMKRELKLRKTLRRFVKKTPGVNFFSIAVEHKIAQETQQVAKCKYQAEECDRLMELLEDYSYTVDAVPPGCRPGFSLESLLSSYP